MNKQTTIKPPDNLALWEALGKTDPRHTKPFKRAGGFTGTAMRPIWIIQRLTEQFGPVGQGWGMGRPTFELVHASEGEVAVYCTVECWHSDPSNVFYGVGGDKAVGKNKHGLNVDDEAFKKAFTDAVGNAFKFLGVGADVHMGLFDDSKYVRDTAREFADAEAGQGHSEESAVSPDQPTDRDARGRNREPGTPSKTQLDKIESEIVREVNSCGDEDMLTTYLLTEEYKAAKAILEEHRPSALYGPAPDNCPEYIPIKALIAGLVRGFRTPAREAMPMDAG